jgi:phi13 family phage major tail protein
MAAFRINIRDLHIAFLEKDDMNGASHEKPDKIPGIMQIQLTPRVKTGQLYGDGIMRDKRSSIDGYDVTFDHNKVPPKILARMLGQAYENGKRYGNAGDNPKQFALGYAVDLTDGNVELTWLYKCVTAPSTKNAQQATDSVNYSTDNMAITSMPLDYNRDYENVVDTSDADSSISKDDVAGWFEAVPVREPQVR